MCVQTNEVKDVFIKHEAMMSTKEVTDSNVEKCKKKLKSNFALLRITGMLHLRLLRPRRTTI